MIFYTESGASTGGLFFLQLKNHGSLVMRGPRRRAAMGRSLQQPPRQIAAHPADADGGASSKGKSGRPRHRGAPNLFNPRS